MTRLKALGFGALLGRARGVQQTAAASGPECAELPGTDFRRPARDRRRGAERRVGGGRLDRALEAQGLGVVQYADDVRLTSRREAGARQALKRTGEALQELGRRRFPRTSCRSA
jgi:hypothetical protein